MKRILKILLAFLILLVAGIFIFGLVTNEPLPHGKTGPEAEALAQKMLNALNYGAYQNTRFLEWSYQGGKNQYTWDRKNDKCTVQWKENRVELILSNPASSACFVNNLPSEEKKRAELIDYAVKNFNNDSFWLVAPYKIFDKGTTRSIVDMDDGSKGLMVTYKSGGTTPGDSYLWKLNPDGFPNSYQMWVKIIPIGGLEATWDDWLISESGAFLPKSHKLGPITLSMGNVKGYND